MFREDAKCSRYMIYSLLASRYYIRDHINESLNQLNIAVVNDLNNLMSSGIAASSGVPLC